MRFVAINSLYILHDDPPLNSNVHKLCSAVKLEFFPLLLKDSTTPHSHTTAKSEALVTDKHSAGTLIGNYPASFLKTAHRSVILSVPVAPIPLSKDSNIWHSSEIK